MIFSSSNKMVFINVSLTLLIFIISGCGNHPQINAGVEAKDALSTFQVAEGFKIELIASEPLISDPVDMEIDEYGRLYVVEMHGYPLDKTGSGNIILLSDADGDGNMDKRTVFAEGLTLPTSVMRWKKGIMVTDAPNILYFEDTDGDGKANLKDTILTGFALSNPQHNVNSPIYGLDNWIYVAHEGSVSTREYKEEFGDEGSEIVFPGRANSPRLPKNANGRSIRFRPDQHEIEMNSSRTQFGHTFDEWGHLFECNNSNQGYHEVIANRYFERNPDLLISDATQDMSDHLNAPEVFPTTTHPDRQLLTNVGVMTAACGLTAYLGGAFPAPYDKNITFITESVSNLVHVDALRDSGASFTASRILKNKEFLSSTDAWSRPVNLYVGPDGALYVLDYYRKVIESPEWMSEEAIKAGGLYDGSDKGRIYRITPKDGKPADWTKGLKLGDASTEELVKELANTNYWWRINAQRLLVDRADKKAVPALTQMAKNTSSPMGRLHALWTLEGIGSLKPELIEQSLKDNEAGIRMNAIRLAELHLSGSPELVKALLPLQTDTDPKVRFQLLLMLGYVNTNESANARNKLLFTDINDKWVQIAALSASSSQTAPILKAVLEKFKPEDPAYESMVQRLTTMIGIGGEPEGINNLIQKATTAGDTKQTTWQAPILEGLSRGLKSRKSQFTLTADHQKMLVQTFFESHSDKMSHSAVLLLKVNGITERALKHKSLERALKIVKDTSQPEQKRARAIDFLSLGDPDNYFEILKKLLVPQEQPIVRLSALRTLNVIPGEKVSKYIIQQWPELTPEIREASINIFLVNPERVNLLLSAIEADKIKAGSISFSNSVQLMLQPDSTLRNRARTLFTKGKEQEKKVNKEYRRALELEGDPLKGKAVYLQNCAICHQVRGEMGVAFGPDLGTVHNWIKEDIMAAVLDPNLSISSGFDLWAVELNNGEIVHGVIASETSTAITLMNNGKQDRTINRQEIRSLKEANVSAMPSGLEKKINKQQMADLLAYLRKH